MYHFLFKPLFEPQHCTGIRGHSIYSTLTNNFVMGQKRMNSPPLSASTFYLEFSSHILETDLAFIYLFIYLFNYLFIYFRLRILKLDISLSITKTYLYNFDPLKPHFYIVKLGYTGVYIIFHISAQKYRLWVLVRTASPRRF